MTLFTSSTQNQAVVTASRSEVWRVLTDPEALPRLTPFLASIDADGDTWRWNLTRIPVLGVSVAPSFTEKMIFDPEDRIEFTHAPPDGHAERASAEGIYDLEEHDGGTKLSIRLSLCVDLPLPRASRAAVERVMGGVVRKMGDRFSANLLRELDAETAT